jgi:ubiquitin C-terminal hydrolase
VHSGRVGLVNLGNTCYLNATIQALACTPPFARYFCETPSEVSETDATGLKEHLRQTLVVLLSTNRDSYAPSQLRREIIKANSLLEGWGQQDAHEALRALLDNANEELATAFPIGVYSNDFGSDRVRLRTGASALVSAESSMQVDSDEDGARPLTPPRRSGAAALPAGSPSALKMSTGGGVQLPPEREWLRYGPHSGGDHVQRSIVSDAFQFVVRSHVRCRTCKGDSFTYTPYYDLSVELPTEPHPVSAGSDGASHPPTSAAWAASPPPVALSEPRSPPTPRGLFSSVWNFFRGGDEPPTVGLGDALYSFFDWERIVGEYRCDLCKTKGDADKRYSIVELPEVLCIHLKRFSYRAPSGMFVSRSAEAVAQKISTSVTFPVHDPLDMSPFLAEGALSHARQSFIRAKALQVGETSPRDVSDSSTGVPPGGSGRLVADVSVESQNILLHRASLMTGKTGVEDASAAASAAAIETASHSEGGGAPGAPRTPPRYPQSFQQAYGPGARVDSRANVLGPVPISQPRSARPSAALYKLTSVVEHQGSIGGGHYITHARDPAPGAAADAWLTYNDERISVTNADEVADQQGYILFFTRRKPTPPSTHAQLTLPSARILSSLSGSGMPVDGADSSGDSGPVYVSRYWWHRYRSFSFPGPITNADILCDHGAVKAKFADKNVAVALTAAEYSALARSYGASEPPLRSLAQCDTCKEERRLLENRRRLEKDEVTKIDSKSPQATDGESPEALWYIISEDWLKKWRAFIEESGKNDGTGRGVLPPGPIDNARLLGKGGTPLPNLKPLVHYRGVNWKVWTFLQNRYGGGPELKRSKISVYV